MKLWYYIRVTMLEYLGLDLKGIGRWADMRRYTNGCEITEDGAFYA